ncbi:alpha-L-arabinofuranosidase C-terminal domain-containing protein [Actinomadura sp. 3N407]|uniref:alpha-L-arabinofuranosidase C-terminal domain-containing protein n=1 Tax=Actinomadura sp. 3N407 TaxID=3457423 RepID=UPI003FCCF654
MPRTRRSPRLALGAAAAAVLVAIPVSAWAQAPAGYTLQIDAAAAGPEIADSMHGIFYEDINRAADGGLYAELVQNRSFEYDPADNGSYTGLTSWTPTSVGGGTGTARVVDDSARLNERNRRHLRLDLAGDGGAYGVTNAGYNTGIAVEKSERYDFSVWARTTGPAGTRLTVRLADTAGVELARPLQITVTGDEWVKYQGTVQAGQDSAFGRLTVAASGSGTVRLDMVSLFPRDTFKNRPNGLREDLAQKIAALNPGFLRFPGGCLVNTGSHYGYESPDYERRRSYQWKDTVGPVEERATNANFWGYNQSYGLGYFEYFQFAEDIGAMPVPVVPALVTGCGQNQATDDPDLLRRHIQDTLDLIEFANGPATSAWGAERAEMGHPEPFGLTHIAVGNEENLPDAFFERFLRFRDAIKGRYPDITVISNSGPDDAGPTFDRAWQLARQSDAEMVDEHYYNDPTWFLENNGRYDTYDRNGPQVFLGEYASRDNRFFNSLAEAAYMTGLERNSDIVKMASYAPLLANVDYVQWRPDLIWFDNHRSWGSTSYETQKLFMNNVGDHVVPSEASGTPGLSEPITGVIGLSTWRTSAAYDDVTVTSAGGGTLFQDDFSAGDSRWTNAADRGTWVVENGAYVQRDTAAENTMVTAGDPAWRDYDVRVKATKRAGAEGFLVAFGVRDTGNYYWWNLGGWDNTRSAVERSTDGAKQTMIEDATRIETGRQYDLRVEVRGRKVTLYLDGQVWGSFTDTAVAEPFRQVVTRDQSTGELIVKVVNAQATAARTRIDLGDGVKVGPLARLTTLRGDPEAVNTADSQPVRPVESTLRGVGNEFTHTFAPYSITFMRVRARP